MINKKVLLGILLILSLVVVSGCTQEPPKGQPTGEIKSEGEVQKTVQNITTDLKDLSNTLNELENVFN